MNNPRYIVVLPVYNEEASLFEALSALYNISSYFIIIDDGSTDKTPDILKKWAKGKNNVYRIRHEKNLGKSAALCSGFYKVLELIDNCDLCIDDLLVLTDADGQIPHNILESACDYLCKHNLDVLIGSRDFSIYPFHKRWGNRLISLVAFLLTGFPFHDSLCGFRSFRLKSLERILPFYSPKGYACEQALSIISALLKLKMDNTFPIYIKIFRSNPRLADALEILKESFKIRLQMFIIKG
jgi:glycosyltransferase involved in cell wall biosynthesis